MLEAVRPNLSLGQGRVGRHEVAEFLDFDFQALLGGNLFHVFHDLGMRSRIDADDHGLIRTGVPLFRLLVAAAAGRKNTQGRQRAGQHILHIFVHKAPPSRAPRAVSCPLSYHRTCPGASPPGRFSTTLEPRMLHFPFGELPFPFFLAKMAGVLYNGTAFCE